MDEISIHALREESDSIKYVVINSDNRISIHALREESDSLLPIIQNIYFVFQSTLSVRRATLYSLNKSGYTFLFQSTLSVRRATWT